MKTIQSKATWINGKNVELSVFNLYATNVLLNQSASFTYYLYPVNAEGVAIPTELMTGVLDMGPDVYPLWQSDTFAWDWGAAELGLTITGDYVPPVSPTE